MRAAAAILGGLLALPAAGQEEPPGAAANGDATGGANAPAAPAEPSPLVRGELRSRYYLRWTGNDNDNDLVTTLSADFGDAAEHDYTGHFMGRLAWDMDGRDPTFASINDSYGRPLDGLVYSAYVDVHEIGGVSLLRLGRQTIWETPEFAFFDGLHVASEELGELAFQAGAYFGSSTHLYETSKSGDITAGTYVQVRPWESGRVRVDYMYLEDDARLRSHRDGLLGAGFWQNFGSDLQLDVQYSRIESRDRDARARALWRRADLGLFVQASYYNLLRTQGDLVLEADPYFNTLNELRPFHQWTLLLGQELGESVQLQAGADLRRVRDRSDIGFYNRDYDRFYGTVILADLGVDGLVLTGTADFWDANAQIVRGGGGDLSYDIDDTTVSLGTYYSLYKYDLFRNSERDDVRTWYFRLRHDASDSVTLEGDYEFEDDDFDDYHRFRLGVTWRF